jgi:adenosylcobinamide-GDP ribazoletransferase
LGLLLLVLLKISLLSNAPASAVPILLLAGHSISRLAPLCLIYRYEYARQNDSKTAAALCYKPKRLELVGSASIALLPLLLLPLPCLLAVLPIALVNHGLGHYFYRQIGGYTGDCLGASQQLAETVFYLSVQAIWTFI